MSRRAIRTTLAALAAVTLAVGAFAVLRPEPSAIERSIEDLRRDELFETSPRAGESLAGISERLLDDGRSCKRAKRTRCDQTLSAAGWSSVAAVTTLRCTQPGTQQIRRDLLDHLVALERDERPALPRLPDC